MPEAARNNHTICDPMFMQQKRNGILWSAVFNTNAHIGIIPCGAAEQEFMQYPIQRCSSQANKALPNYQIKKKKTTEQASPTSADPILQPLSNSFLIDLESNSDVIHLKRRSRFRQRKCFPHKKMCSR